MDNLVVKIAGVCKKYAIGERYSPGTLYESISDYFKESGKKMAQKNDFWALRDISFTISAGEILGVIGENGSGKSTLLRIISRITGPTSGEIRLRGRVTSLLELGTGFNPELTGRENIFLNGAILGMSRSEIRRKFHQIVEFSEIEKFLDSPVKHYSSGMYMRLAFSIAAHLEPEILLLDEILAVGDIKFQEKSLVKMEEIAKSGATIIFVSHDTNSVRRLCQRCLLLEEGRVKAIGEVSAVVAKYLGTAHCSKSHLDLSRLGSEFGRREIQPMTVSLENGLAGKFAAYWHQPLELRLMFKVNASLSNISFGIGCSTREGVPVFTIRNSDSGGSKIVNVKNGQQLRLSIKIDHNLAPGLYNLALGINSGSIIYFYNPRMAQVEIRDHKTNGYLTGNPGLVHCQSRWTI